MRRVSAAFRRKGLKVTLLELGRSLPNGFHDAHIHRFSVEYVKREATITLDVLVGIPEGKNKLELEAYRKCLLKLTGLEYFIIDPPDTTYKYAKPGTLWIDAGPLDTAKLNAKVKLPSLQAKNALAYLFSYKIGIHRSMLQLPLRVWNGYPNHLCQTIIDLWWAKRK